MARAPSGLAHGPRAPRPALTSFGPAIAIAIKGPDLTTTAYVGDRPGAYATYFVLFLISWVPILVLAAALVRRFRLRAVARLRGA